MSHPKEQMQNQCLPECGDIILARSCGVVVGLAAAGALPNPVYRPGSLICHGDVIFQYPALTSLEVLEALVLSVGPNKALAGSDFQVDPFSLAVGGRLPFGVWEHEVHQCVAPCLRCKSRFVTNQIQILCAKGGRDVLAGGVTSL